MTIETATPDLPAAAEILRDYLREMISRYYGRPTDDAEINRHLGAGHDSDDLVERQGEWAKRTTVEIGEDIAGRVSG